MRSWVAQRPPGPNVLLLLVNPFTQGYKQTPTFILSLSDQDAFKHSMVISTLKALSVHNEEKIQRKHREEMYNLVKCVTKNRENLKKIQNLLTKHEEEMKKVKTEEEKKKLEQQHEQQRGNLIRELMEKTQTVCFIL